MSAVYRMCPACGDEFQSWVTRCPDCDEAIVETSDPASLRAGPPSEDLPSARELHCLAVGVVARIREVSEQLQRAGIANRIDRDPQSLGDEGDIVGGFGQNVRLGVYVREAELAAAQAALHDLNIRDLHDVPDEVGDPNLELDACPACGEAIDEDAAECASCGLAFGG